MFFKPFVFICSLLAVANAHFQLQYPAPRGPFVASKEPTFCDGYTNVTTNRTAFPLSNGFLSLVSEHENWTAGVIISVFPNPNSFDDFNANNGQPQIVRGYAKAAAAGTYCLPLNISSAGIFGLTDGTDVTIQVVFNGGDGNLYQCADLTLSSSLTSLPPSVSCQNSTASVTGTSPTTSQTSTSTNGAVGSLSVRGYYVGAAAVLVGIVAGLL